MSRDIEAYLKELSQIKNLGVLEGNDAEELENLIKMVQTLNTDEEVVGDITPQYPQRSFNEPEIKTNDLHKVKIKFVNTSNNPDIDWAKEGDSGFDLRANLPEGEKEVILEPLERMLIPTGLYFELPEGYELQIRPRSGHSFKTGLMAILGTVDTGYRGEVKVIMINLDKNPQKIEQGERIAQGVVASRISTELGKLIKLESTRNLRPSDRGTGGFGSTGVK